MILDGTQRIPTSPRRTDVTETLCFYKNVNDGDSKDEEETMHGRVEEVESQSQGGYTMSENLSIGIDMP